MDNGAANLGGAAPGEDAGDASGAGVPSENVREGAREAVSEAARKAAVDKIAAGARKILVIRTVETKAAGKRGAVAEKLAEVLEETPIAGELLAIVVHRATKVDKQITANARAELEAIDPLPDAAKAFLGLKADEAANNNNNYAAATQDADDERAAA